MPKKYKRSNLSKLYDSIGNHYRRMYLDMTSGYKGNEDIPISANYILPNVVVRPDKTTLSNLKKVLPDEDLRHSFYKLTSGTSAISEQEAAKRLYELYKLANMPSLDGSTPFNLLGRFNENRFRPTYNAITNTINLPGKTDFRDYVEELSHALQFNDEGLVPYGLKYNIGHGIGDIWNYGFPDSSVEVDGEKYRTNYQNPNHYEHKAHMKIKPAIDRYLLGILTASDKLRGAGKPGYSYRGYLRQ